MSGPHAAYQTIRLITERAQVHPGVHGRDRGVRVAGHGV